MIRSPASDSSVLGFTHPPRSSRPTGKILPPPARLGLPGHAQTPTQAHRRCWTWERSMTDEQFVRASRSTDRAGADRRSHCRINSAPTMMGSPSDSLMLGRTEDRSLSNQEGLVLAGSRNRAV